MWQGLTAVWRGEAGVKLEREEGMVLLGGGAKHTADLVHCVIAGSQFGSECGRKLRHFRCFLLAAAAPGPGEPWLPAAGSPAFMYGRPCVAALRHCCSGGTRLSAPPRAPPTPAAAKTTLALGNFVKT